MSAPRPGRTSCDRRPLRPPMGYWDHTNPPHPQLFLLNQFKLDVLNDTTYQTHTNN